MKATKILESTLIAGNTSVIFTDSDIPNSLIRVYTTDSNLYPINSSLSGTTLTVNFEQQQSNIGVAVELVKEEIDIIDNLETDDSTKVLSAKQGKALKNIIDTIPTSLEASDISFDNTISGMTADDVQDAIDEVFTSVSNGKTLIADAITDKGVPTSASDSFSTMATNISNISGSSGAEVLENFKGTFYLPRTGNWKPHTMEKSGYITAMFICTYSGQTVQIRKGTTSIGTIAIVGSTQQAIGAHRVAVNAGDVIQVWKSADANGACEYILIFESE